MFFNLVPYQRFKDTKRSDNLRVGDVCLLSYPGKIRETYRYCRIIDTQPDQDGVVRNVTVSMRSRNKREQLQQIRSKKPVEIVVGVARLVLLCPAEEIKMMGDNLTEMTVNQIGNLSFDMQES